MEQKNLHKQFGGYRPTKVGITLNSPLYTISASPLPFGIGGAFCFMGAL